MTGNRASHPGIKASLERWGRPHPEPDRIPTLIARSIKQSGEDLDEARDAVEKNHASSALNNLEEAIAYMGYALGYAYGYKPAGVQVRGFHEKVFATLILYTETFRPDLAVYARRFQALRTARNELKYPDDAVHDVPYTQVKQFYAAASAFWDRFKDEPLDSLLR